MMYAGIDIAKFNHFASALSSDGKITLQPFKFTNDYDGFHLLAQKLNSLDSDELIIGLESTVIMATTLFNSLLIITTRFAS